MKKLNIEQQRRRYELKRRARMILRAPQLVPLYYYNHGIYNCKRFYADSLSRFGYYRYPHKIIFHAGMAMGATTWMKNLLSRIPGYFMRKIVMPYEDAYLGKMCDSVFDHVPKYGYSLFKTHMLPTQENFDCLMRNGVEKILVTHRDLRDVFVSRYYRLLSDPKKPFNPDYIDYVSMGKEKALSHSMEAVGDKFVSWIRGWFEIAEKNPGCICFVGFEDMKDDTEKAYRKVLDFYGITLEDSLIKENIRQAQGGGKLGENLKKAKVTPFAISSNFRAGKVGGWKNDLTEAQKKRAKELFGAILIELGYERDLSW